MSLARSASVALVSVVALIAGLAPVSSAQSPAECSAEAQLPGTRYYFHSVSGLGNQDWLNFDNTYNTSPPTIPEFSMYMDVVGLRNTFHDDPFDPAWEGTVSGPISKVTFMFWGKTPIADAGGPLVDPGYFPTLWIGDTAHDLDVTTAVKEIELGNAPTCFIASKTFDPPLDPGDEIVTASIRAQFFDVGQGSHIFYDSTEYPSGFSISTVADPDPDPTGTASPSPTVTEPPPPPPGECGSYPATPNDTFWIDAGVTSDTSGGQWGLRKIGANEAWQEPNATGCGIRVAVLDSGIDVGGGSDLHPDLACPGKVEIQPRTDTVQNDGVPNDENGHGTHVAGIIGACTNNSTGVAGVAPDSTIVPIRVLNAAGSGTDAQLVAGLDRATELGVHVINMSLGYPPGKQIINNVAAIDAALARAQAAGIVVVAAAGNDSTPLCEYPALAEDVVCVGSTDSRDLKAGYGTFPNKTDAEDTLGPAVVAPGGSGTLGFVFCQQTDEEIISTYLRAGDACGDVGYEAIFGTSMATPHVAGVAALVYERLGGEPSVANANQVIETIVSTAEDLGTPGYDPVFASGRVDALAAVRAVGGDVVATNLSYTGALTAQHSDEASLQALLVDDQGDPIEGAEVTFEVGPEGSEALSARTGPDGIATTSFIVDEPAGAYQLTARYTGEDGVFLGSADEESFVVQTDDSDLAVTVTGKNSSRRVNVVLSDLDSGAGLARRSVAVYADGVLIGNIETDANGAGSLAAPKKDFGKDPTFEASFAGDDFYGPVSDQVPS